MLLLTQDWNRSSKSLNLVFSKIMKFNFEKSDCLRDSSRFISILKSLFPSLDMQVSKHFRVTQDRTPALVVKVH